jgi:hypothetical protein
VSCRSIGCRRWCLLLSLADTLCRRPEPASSLAIAWRSAFRRRRFNRSSRRHVSKPKAPNGQSYLRFALRFVFFAVFFAFFAFFAMLSS